MSNTIYGTPVGTPISPKKIEEVLNPVKTVNGQAPDENGNVEVNIPEGGSLPSVGKKWLFIGDSITEHNFRASKNYDQFLSDWLGIISVNRGMSSTGVTHSLTSSPTWLNDLPNYPDDVDCISIMGALNDRHTPLGVWGDRGTDTVYGGVWNYFNSLIEKYPNTPIIYITSTPREYSYGVDGQFTALVDAFIKTAENFSIPVLDLYRTSGLRPWNATNNATYFSCSSAPNGDGVHPNALGQELMAKKILEFAKTHLIGLWDCVPGDAPDDGVNGEDVDTIDSLSWESGAISDGKEATDSKRIRTGFVDIQHAEVEIQVANGYQIAVWHFDDNKNFVGSAPTYESWLVRHGWSNYVRIVAKRSDNGTMTADEGSAAIASIVYSTPQGETLDDMVWELGAIIGTSGNAASSTRIRTDRAVNVSEYNQVSATFDNTLYKVSVLFYADKPCGCSPTVNNIAYDSSGNYIVSVPNNATYMRLVFAHVDDSAITPEEASELTISLL